MITKNEGEDETDLRSSVDCTRARYDREVGTIPETQSGSKHTLTLARRAIMSYSTYSRKWLSAF